MVLATVDGMPFPMMATLDPHMNLLRCAAAVFGAGLGGASGITVLPFSLPQGLPNAFARRIARNMQHVLIGESGLWRVSDPASGAGYVEHLTEALCAGAWGIFQRVEAAGGMAEALRQGLVSGIIEANPDAPRGPVIGVEVYKLAEEFAAAVELP